MGESSNFLFHTACSHGLEFAFTPVLHAALVCIHCAMMRHLLPAILVCMHCVACYAEPKVAITQEKYHIFPNLHAELQIAWEYSSRFPHFKEV